MINVEPIARFIDGLSRWRREVESGGDPFGPMYEAQNVAYDAASDIRDLSDDDAWKTPWNEFRTAFGKGRISGMSDIDVIACGERAVSRLDLEHVQESSLMPRRQEQSPS
jgi:hypothetical protein